MSRRHRVVVTGLGVVAGNGSDRESFCQAIFAGQTGIHPVTRFDASKFRSPLAGQADVDLGQGEGSFVDPTVKLAGIALSEALADAKLTSADIAELGPRAGLSFAGSHGGTGRIVEYVKQTLQNEEPSPQWLGELNMYTNRVAHMAGIHGPCWTTVSACAAGSASGGIALDMIRNGRVDLMVWGGADPLMQLSYCGFHVMRALSPEGCPKPFDKNRDGLVIGEGAAMMVLERLDRALERGAHIYAEVVGYGISNDAYHATAPDPEGGGAIRAMEMALADAKLTPGDIDYINAHGTATQANDTMEVKAIKQVFRDHASRVPISSTKSMTGHALGAAGSIEAAVCLLAIDRGFLPPTSTLEEPEEGAEELNLIKGCGVKADVRTAMSNSFAFAGNMACIVFQRYE